MYTVCVEWGFYNMTFFFSLAYPPTLMAIKTTIKRATCSYTIFIDANGSYHTHKGHNLYMTPLTGHTKTHLIMTHKKKTNKRK